MNRLFKYLLCFCLLNATLHTADISGAPNVFLESIERAILNRDFQFILKNTMRIITVFSPNEGPEFTFESSMREIRVGNKTFSLEKFLFETKQVKHVGIYARCAFEIVKGRHERQVYWNELSDHPGYVISNTYVKYSAPEGDGVKIFFKKINQRWLISAIEYTEANLPVKE